jgi:uncharacterized membrane-anchored protein YjiN (DUF445 family)
VIESPGEEIEQEMRLRRIKRLATALFGACGLLYCVAIVLKSRWESFEYLAAFAGAAMVGALADWYAVVALFRHPLGLPLPHTAIIAQNQVRIGEALGRFVGTHFLAPERVSPRLAELDVARQLAAWLEYPGRADELARYLVRRAPVAVARLDDSAIVRFAADELARGAGELDISEPLAEVANFVVESGHHHAILDEILDWLGRFLKDPQAQQAFKEHIRKELPTAFAWVRAEEYVFRRLSGAADGLLGEIRDDHAHPLRSEFESFLRGLAGRIRSSNQFHQAVDSIKKTLLDKLDLGRMIGSVYDSARRWLERDSVSENSRTVAVVALLMKDAALKLREDARFRHEVNDLFVQNAVAVVGRYRGEIAEFIAHQVKQWDTGYLVRVVELNIGRDLQFIRINGTLIGGMLGLVIHLLTKLVLG